MNPNSEGSHYVFHGNQVKKVERIPTNKPWSYTTVKPYRQIGFETAGTPNYAGRVGTTYGMKEPEMGVWTSEGWKRVALDSNGHVKDVVDQMEHNRSSWTQWGDYAD